MSNKQQKILMWAGILSVSILIFSLFAIRVATIQGSQSGVKETWSEGVVNESLHPGTYILFPGWSQTIYAYDTSTQVFEMENLEGQDAKTVKTEKDKHRADAFHVASSDNQDLAISLIVRWHRDSTKVVDLHKTVRGQELKLVSSETMRIVKDNATKLSAIYAYSGEGLVKLQNDIHNAMTDPTHELAKRGIVVENFVIKKIDLDPKYVGEIRSRQVATQRKLRIIEETKAADMEALKAKSEAQADYNKRVVEAERDKQVGILKAQQDAQTQILKAEATAKQTELAAEASRKQTVLAAKGQAEQIELSANANKKQAVLSAEGEKEAGLLKAQAIQAIGAAEAGATKLRLSAYSVTGSDNFTKIKVAEAMATGFSGIKGYLPSDMTVHVISENFLKSIDQVLSAKTPKTAKPKAKSDDE